MIKGIEIFKDFFKEYKDQYVLIGGAACDIIMEETESGFRATKDLDIVLIVEALTPEFGKTFWNFINEGRYRNKSRSSGEPQFYRFDKPETPGFPYMIELFSRMPFEMGRENQILVPVHIDDEVSSLSAILLNDAYYQMLLDGRTEVEGLIILKPVFIIPFKAKAWLDLTDKRNRGMNVDEKDIRKHKNDIARLAVVLDGNDSILLPEDVREDMDVFLNRYEREPADLKNLQIRDIANAEIIRRLRDIYQL
ncbi:MAG: hypothetical protein J1E03_05725 [Acetatifactor sp.]|nr:hypothetical protein [Acetatifactor sp.]